MKSVILIGLPASGKSSVGKALAREIGYNFIDTDEILANEFGVHASKLFIEYGERKFREFESQAFKKALKLNDVVIATGGGIVTVDNNFINIDHRKFLIINLTRRIDKLVINNRRPLLKTRADAQRLYNQRKFLYNKYSDYTINNSHFKFTVNEIIAIIKKD